MKLSKSAKNIILVLLFILVQTIISYIYTTQRDLNPVCKDKAQRTKQLEDIRSELFKHPEKSERKIKELEACLRDGETEALAMKLNLLRAGLDFHANRTSQGQREIAQFLKNLEDPDQGGQEDLVGIGVVFLFELFRGAGSLEKKQLLCAKSEPESFGGLLNSDGGRVLSILKIFFELRCKYELAEFDAFQVQLQNIQSFRARYFRENQSMFDVQMKLNVFLLEALKYQFNVCLVRPCKESWRPLLKRLRAIATELSVYYNSPVLLSDLDILELRGLIKDKLATEAVVVFQKIRGERDLSRAGGKRLALELEIERYFLESFSDGLKLPDSRELSMEGVGTELSDFYQLVGKAASMEWNGDRVIGSAPYEGFVVSMGRDHFLLQRLRQNFR